MAYHWMALARIRPSCLAESGISIYKDLHDQYRFLNR